MYKNKAETKPLQLRKMTQDTLRWSNFLVRKGQRHHFNLEGDSRDFSITLYPGGVDNFQFNIGLLVEVDGIPAPLWLSAWPLTERIREYVSEYKVQDIPLQLRVELIESALRPLISWVSQTIGARVRIINFLTLKPTQTNPLSVCFRLYEGDSAIRGMLIVHERLRPFIEQKLETGQDQYNPLWDKHLTSMQLEVGYIDITVNELYDIELGDVLLFNAKEDIANQCLRLRLPSGQYYRGRLNGTGVNIESGVNSMSEEYAEMEQQTVANADELPVRLTFDLGELTLPFEQIKLLKPDYVLDLNQPFGDIVKIRSQNKLIGTGELVDINGKVGVRLLELFGAKSNG